VEFEVPFGGEGIDLHLVKTLVLRGGGERFEARFRLENHGADAASGWFCSEWNLNMLSGNGPDRYYEGMGDARDLSSSGAAKGVRGFRVVDAWRNVAAAAALNRECVVLRGRSRRPPFPSRGRRRSTRGSACGFSSPSGWSRESMNDIQFFGRSNPLLDES